MKPDGFERMLHYLPEKFERDRSWCHVFVTDCDDNAVSLLYLAVLDILNVIFFRGCEAH